MPEKKFHVTGCVIDNKTKQGIAGLRVEAWDKDFLSIDYVAEARTNENGEFSLSFTTAHFKKLFENQWPDLFFKIYYKDDLIKSTEKDVLWDVKSTKKNIGDIEVDISTIVEQCEVNGCIFFDNGLPAVEIPIKLYNQKFGANVVPLAIGKTDTKGNYTISYNSSAAKINLELYAIDPTGKEIQLCDTKFNAEKTITLNLVAPQSIAPLDSEYQRLTADIMPHIGSMDKLADAKESKDQEDITILCQACRWDARLIALLAKAVRLSKETGIPAKGLYALFRVGLPSEQQKLSLLNIEMIEKSLDLAEEANIVQFNAQDKDAIKTAFTDFAKEVRLTVKTPWTLSSIGDMLETSKLSKEEKEAFEEIYFNYAGKGAELWRKAIEANISEDKVNELRLQGKLAYLTLNNIELTKWLQSEIGTLNDLKKLVDLNLYKKDVWKSQIEKIARKNSDELEKLIPPLYKGKEVSERLEGYAADLARKVRISYPTRVVIQMIKNDELHYEDQNQLKKRVIDFLEKAQELHFQFGLTPVESFVRDNKDDLFGDSDVDFEAVEESKKVDRLYQITPSDEAHRLIFDLGFRSAHDVVAFSKEKFIDLFTKEYVNRFGEERQPEIQGRLIYQKAQQVTSVVSNVFALAKQLEYAPELYCASPCNGKREQTKNKLIKHYPKMESLFGSLDFCECEHCRSVLSPAAYFVDLLEFLNPDDRDWENTLSSWLEEHSDVPYPFTDWLEYDKWKDHMPADLKPYSILTERRPDLPHLHLTCENTNTSLPYIDIVNEILEYYVANNSPITDSYNESGDVTTDELLAEPQNILPQAYQVLKDARFPLNLPFDLWIEMTRCFFHHFEAQLWQTLDVFRQSDELFPPEQNLDPDIYYFRSAIFNEYLGFSPVEYTIFTDKAPLSNWSELYGYPDETEALDSLKSAKILSRRLGVTYKQLVDIICTGFINPKLDSLVILRKLGIEIIDVFRYFGENAYSDYEFTEDEKAVFEERLEAIKIQYGFNAKEWLINAYKYNEFDKIILLFDIDPGCNFDATTLCYADGTDVEALVYYKINLFVRLWKKLDWTIKEIDRSLQVFIPFQVDALTDSNIGDALQTALIYVAHLKALNESIKSGKHNHIELLTIWSNIHTTGKKPLYEQLFLTPAILKYYDKNNSVFDHPTGDYLSNENIFIKDHLLALQDALGLTTNEIKSIVIHNNHDFDTAILSLDIVSQLYRYSILSSALDLSIDDLITLKQLSGLDPFKPLLNDVIKTIDDDYPFNNTLKFVEIVEKIKESQIQIEDLNYLFRHQYDPVGTYRKNSNEFLNLVKTLSDGIIQIKLEHAIPDHSEDITDELALEKLGLVMPQDVVDVFSGYYNNTIEFSATMGNVTEGDKLNPAIYEVNNIKVSYDSNRQLQLVTHTGILTDEKIADILIQIPEPVAQNFIDLISDIAIKSQQMVGEFFKKNFGNFFSYDDIFGRTIQFDAVLGDPGLAETGLVNPTQVKGFISSYLSYFTGQTMTNDPAKIQIKIGDEGPYDVLISGRPGDINELRAALEMGIRAAHTSASFTDAQVVKINNQLLIISGTPEDIISLAPGTDDPALAEIGFAAPTRINGVCSGDLSGFSGLTNDPAKILITIGGDGPHEVSISNTPTNIDELRDELEKGVRAAHSSRLFKEALVVKINDRLFILPGVLEKARRILEAFHPFLINSLTKQFITRTLALTLESDLPLIELLLTDTDILVDPNQSTAPSLKPLNNAFMMSAVQGVSCAYLNASGIPLDEKIIPNIELIDAPANTHSVRFNGYFEVPENSSYYFSILLDQAAPNQDTEIEFRLSAQSDPVILCKAPGDKFECNNSVALQAGLLYEFTLEIRNLQNRSVTFLVKGETVSEDQISQFHLYPHSIVNEIDNAFVLIKKTIQLMNNLDFNKREVHYILTHAADFENIDLNKLPKNKAEYSKDSATALFIQFLRLLDYSMLKEKLSGESDDIIDIFEYSRTIHAISKNKSVALAESLDKLYELFALLTRRNIEEVKSVVEYFKFNEIDEISEDDIHKNEDKFTIEIPDFTNEKGLNKLWLALQVLEKLGVSVDKIESWTKIVNIDTPNETAADIARELKNTVKARCETENWLRIAQPIFDKLRRYKRDALVAYIMNKDDLDSMESLFEFFLIDPGMEPIVQTSRLQLAISSVQLFVQRSLLNLEPMVAPHPDVINAQHWSWMKRYRVWEANRKIFLFPENWLEPEFRDDKTHLFQELEGELLQGDVSKDLVEDAFFKYLQQLDELARLEIVTIFWEEPTSDMTDNILHVIGRTYNEPSKYFYRRYSYHMWTPWEPVPVPVQGNHIAATFWRERLHLFWVTFRIIPKEPTKNNSDILSSGTKLGEIEIKEISKFIPQNEVELQLNWCEYFQGQWGTQKSTEFYKIEADNDMNISDSNKDDVFIQASKEIIDDEGIRYITINLYNPIMRAFKLISKNSMPSVEEIKIEPISVFNANDQKDESQKASLLKITGPLTLGGYIKLIETEDESVSKIWIKSLNILKKEELNYYLTLCEKSFDISPNEKKQIEQLTAPFFFQDNQNSFFIHPLIIETTIEETEEYGGMTTVEPDALTWFPPPVDDSANRWVDPGAPYENEFDQAARFEILPTNDWLTQVQTAIMYDQRIIGQNGGIDYIIPSDTTNIKNMGASAPVIPGSNWATGNIIIPNLDRIDLHSKALIIAKGLMIVGDDGLNSILIQNLNMLQRF